MKLLDKSIFDLIIWPLSRINRVKNSWAGGSSRHAFVYDHVLSIPFLVACTQGLPLISFILLVVGLGWHVIGKELWDVKQGKGPFNVPNFLERLYGWGLAVVIFLLSRIL